MTAPRPIRRILLIKPSSLGDIVHALPTLAALKQRFPQAAVTWAVKRAWAGLVERAEGVDQVLTLEGSFVGWLSHIPRLRADRYDVVVDLQGLFRSGLLARLSGCPRRVGLATAREGSPWFYTERVAVPDRPMHAVERYLLIAEALGATVGPPRFGFVRLEADQQAVRTLLDRHGLTAQQRWIAMSVSARWLTKRWPAEHFAEAADRLTREGLGPVVMIGGPAERADAARVRSLMRANAVDLTGQTEVGLLPELLQQAAALVTNDSGPMHVAAAVGTPVVALFGPTDPVRTGPYGRDHQVLSGDVVCRPCMSRHCRHSIPMACLSGVSADRVVQAVRDRVRTPTTRPCR